MDWRDAVSYEFEPPLAREEWAWQFLRRNPEYAADYAWFIATWRALEANYGAPPRRDFFRWRQDPRACRAADELAGCSAETCPGENDQVLIAGRSGSDYWTRLRRAPTWMKWLSGLNCSNRGPNWNKHAG